MNQYILFLVDHSDWRDGVAHGPFTNEDDARKYAEILKFSDAKDIDRNDGEFEYVLCMLVKVPMPQISSAAAIALARLTWFEELGEMIEPDACTAEMVNTAGWVVTGNRFGRPFVTANVVSEGIVDDYERVA